ncbi:MAG TPA: PQQ-binding-like beta-propeller repeat protein [Gemmata sp.]
MTLRVRLLVCAFLIGATATSSLSADWPGFRGPNRDGVCTETGLLKSWPKDGPKLVWTAKNLGLGWGTPSVADGVIYGVGTRDKKDGVWAIKESDGTELWFTPFADPATGLGNQTNGPASTPTVHKGKVYTVSANGTLSCLSAKDGKEVWSKNYARDFGGPPAGRGGVTWGYSDSVLADGDKIICAPGGTGAAVVALNADTGETVWKADVGKVGGGNGYSSPIKASFAGTPAYVAELGNASGLVAVNADTGKLLWQYKGTPATGGVAQIPIPIVKGDLVWVSTSYGGGSALLQIVPKGKGEFEVKEVKAYRKPQLNNHHGGMVLVGDYIYFGHDQNQGNPVCVELKTGQIKWGPEKPPAGGQGSAAVLAADGRLYFRYQNGVMVLMEPSPEELKVVSSFKLPAADQRSYPQSWPHPVIANGKLLIRDQTVLYCYDIKAKK